MDDDAIVGSLEIKEIEKNAAEKLSIAENNYKKSFLYVYLAATLFTR